MITSKTLQMTTEPKRNSHIMNPKIILVAALGSICLAAIADDGIRPIPKTSREAFAQCEAINRERGIADDCRDDFVYKTFKETEDREASAKASAEARRAAAAEAQRAAAIKAAKPSPRIGMSHTMVIDGTNWGGPYRTNRTTTAAGVTEQWIYGERRYLYFTNGKLTAIQE